MIHLKRRVSAVFLVWLIILIVTGIAGCAKDKPQNEKNDGTLESTAEAGKEEEIIDYSSREYAKDNLPDGLDFGGQDIRIMHHEEDIWGYEIDVEQDTADIVKDAIYRRNRLVEERLNVNIKTIPFGGIYTDPVKFFTHIKKSVNAGDDEIDLVAGYGYISSSLGAEGFYLNWRTVDYIDLRQPWWSSDFEDQMTYDGKLYFTVGDIGITLLSKMFCVYFNKDLAADYELGNLYQTVLEGNWTLDTLGQLSKNIYIDLNGDGIADGQDLYGCAISTGNFIDAMYAAFDYRITQKDENGIPQLTMNTPKMADMVTRVYDLLYNNAGTFTTKEENRGLYENRDRFSENRIVFLLDFLETNEEFRAIETNYGILPYPKWDKDQSAYRTSIQLALSMFSIPTTCQSPDMVGAVSESLCVESYRSVSPAYYEIALKQKYSRDEETSKMLDIIRDGVFFDFGYMNSYTMDGYHTVFRDLMRDKKIDFVSSYEKGEKKYQKALDKLLAAYESNP